MDNWLHFGSTTWYDGSFIYLDNQKYLAGNLHLALLSDIGVWKYASIVALSSAWGSFLPFLDIKKSFTYN